MPDNEVFVGGVRGWVDFTDRRPPKKGSNEPRFPVYRNPRFKGSPIGMHVGLPVSTTSTQQEVA